MFRILKNFVIYLHILSCTAFPPTIPPPTEKVTETTTDIELDAQVKQEFLSFKNLLSKLMISPLQERLLIQGIILGKLEVLLEMFVRRASKVDNLLKKQGLLEIEKERSDLYRVLLGVGHRVDNLEQMLSAGSTVKLEGPRDKRWIAILKLDNPLVNELRKKIVEKGMTVEIFAASVQKICQERNERAGYGDVSLPEVVLKENSLDKVLKMMKIYHDENAKRTLGLLLSPLTFPSSTSSSSSNSSISAPAPESVPEPAAQ